MVVADCMPNLRSGLGLNLTVDSLDRRRWRKEWATEGGDLP